MAQPYVFVYANWITRYPEFTAVSEPVAQGYFDLATIYWRNDGTSPNNDPVPPATNSSQGMLLNLLTAHIAAMRSQSQGSQTPGGAQDANTPVGRISQATQGSVSVTTELNLEPGQAAWFSQTKYGMDFWQATAAWRTMRYKQGALQPGGLGYGGYYPSMWQRGGRY
jgi:hypothetical protein